jgi:hypothetical protein
MREIVLIGFMFIYYPAKEIIKGILIKILTEN